ncbi:hypothetical protein KK083_10885 [Fulvivirgaceae bacterium PWU4]|uniref:Porin n=1 Tax=Chryseosolibacter histidini TaxID=2782349 RepID=A0AAP2DJ95_9BACT|nr:putative porin [Chryseosolibacter histidini]MBT1697383.1 hypothetical protein [Chryseosolibacter histidini]
MPEKDPVAVVSIRLPLPVLYASRFRLLIAGLLVLCALASMAQQEGNRRGSRVIDDTTKQVYGPNTSRYFYEQDAFENREVLHPIDTSINNFHRWDYVQRYNNLYQDLGLFGTAIQPIYYQAPDVIGVRSGSTVYDVYWDSEAVRYYNTHSPYSNMRVILGGRGRSLTRATFSRNINENWNFGFTYRGLFIDKQVGGSGKNDRITRSNYYDFYTTYQSKDSTYRLFFNFRRGFHRVEEYGGVSLDSLQSLDLANYFETNAQPWLTNAESNDLRIAVHLFHEYKVGKALQLYHTFDRYRQKSNFLDIQTATSADYYDYQEIDNDSTRDVSKFKTVRNEIGIKGNLLKLFYNGYYAIRHYSMSNPNFTADGILNASGNDHLTYDSLKIGSMIGNESYLGGRMSLKLDSIGEVSGWAEVMQEGNYRLQGEIRSRWFEARLTQMQYEPTFFEQAYRGAHDVWNNNFGNTSLTRLNGYLHYNSRVFNISPGLTFTRLRNYVFFKQVSEVDTVQQVLPVQSGGNQVMASPEVRLSVTFLRHITLSGRAIYTHMIENADSAIQVPKLFVNAQLSYSNVFFNGNLDMHAGVDVHWKSPYYAPGYDPAVRQFYTQTSFEVPSFPLVDLFFGARIKRGRVFFKYHNLVYALTKEGYLPTPNYPAQRNAFDFGFDWSFYD